MHSSAIAQSYREILRYTAVFVVTHVNVISFLNARAAGTYLFFFFQAEDGIRDHCVTGVQTCALPISGGCCGFDNPSINLANAYKTDASGLPLFNTFNDDPFIDSATKYAGTLDPRDRKSVV